MKHSQLAALFPRSLPFKTAAIMDKQEVPTLCWVGLDPCLSGLLAGSGQLGVQKAPSLSPLMSMDGQHQGGSEGSFYKGSH